MSKLKKVFFITALALLILSVSIVSATNDTTTDSSTNDASSIEHTNVQKDAKVIKETSKSNIKTSKNKIEEKTINKTDKTEKQTKTDTKTIEVSDYNSFINAFDEINDDNSNEYFIISLKEGDYQAQGRTTSSSNKPILVEANNQAIKGGGFATYIFNCNNLTIRNGACCFLNTGNLTLTNMDIDGINNAEATAKLTVINSTITDDFNNDGNMTLINTIVTSRYNENNGIIQIDEESTLTPEQVTGNGQIIPYGGEQPQQNTKTIEKENITTQLIIGQTKTYEIINCNISAKITNQGKCDKQFSFPL